MICQNRQNGLTSSIIFSGPPNAAILNQHFGETNEKSSSGIDRSITIQMPNEKFSNLAVLRETNSNDTHM